MMLAKKRILAALFVLLCATQGAIVDAGQVSAAGVDETDYRDVANWLCRPGGDDVCNVPLESTVVAGDGSLEVQPGPIQDGAPGIDCFYLYPTASLDQSSNSDLVPGAGFGEELDITTRQFARFRGTCRTFAPMYRAGTITAMIGLAPTADFELAYRDVRAAWLDYLKYDNQGRGVILIGHSQGALMVKRLLTEFMDDKPMSDILVAAYPIGIDVAVPPGKVVGGDFVQIPLCQRADQTGCIVSYNTFRSNMPPTDRVWFAQRISDGMEAACVNPAALSGADAPLQAYLPTEWRGGGKPSPQAPWTTTGEQVATPFVQVPGLLRAECGKVGAIGYLAVSVQADPSDARVDDIKGDVEPEGKIIPEWGLHIIDIELALGDLISLARQQSAAWADKQPE